MECQKESLPLAEVGAEEHAALHVVDLSFHAEAAEVVIAEEGILGIIRLIPEAVEVVVYLVLVLDVKLWIYSLKYVSPLLSFA